MKCAAICIFILIPLGMADFASKIQLILPTFMTLKKMEFKSLFSFSESSINTIPIEYLPSVILHFLNKLLRSNYGCCSSLT